MSGILVYNISAAGPWFRFKPQPVCVSTREPMLMSEYLSVTCKHHARDFMLRLTLRLALLYGLLTAGRPRDRCSTTRHDKKSEWDSREGPPLQQRDVHVHSRVQSPHAAMWLVGPARLCLGSTAFFHAAGAS